MAPRWRSKISANAVGSPSERARQSASDGTCSITLTVPEVPNSLSASVCGQVAGKSLPDSSGFERSQTYRVNARSVSAIADS